jgi:rhodanese-related sulfurtransferase
MTADRISPSEALRLMREQAHLYLDVRSVTEFELGHPEGAYNLPWRHDPGVTSLNPDFLAVAERAFARDAPLIVGCRSNNRSVQAASALREAGFRNVHVQRAGMAGVRDAFGGLREKGWEAEGLPVSLQAQAGRSYAALRDRAGVTG